MKNISKIFVLIIFAFSCSFIGWSEFNTEQSNSVTNLYYYQGGKFYLNHKPDMIYIKLKNEISRIEFNSIINQYGDIPQDYSFENNDIRQMVKLRFALDNISLNNVIRQVKNNANVEYASPVFSMIDGTGNDNTLIGCENNIIVQFKPYYNKEQITQYLTGKGLSIVKELELTGGLSFIIQIPFVNGKTSVDFANEIFSSGMTNFSDPGFFYTNLLQYTPNDTFYPMQWSPRNVGNNIPGGIVGTPDCDMGVDSAWNQTLGITQVRISVVDTGIDTLHEDLAANILHGYQYNYYAGTPGGADDYNHGTAVAGIIGAVGNNNMGVSGICPTVRLFSAKIFNSGGSTTTTAIVNGLIGVRTFGNSWISSNSWGGGSPISAANTAITDGTTLGRNGKGIVWSFATGNGNGGALSWPSTQPEVISVGGNSPCNQRKSTSSCDLENFWGANYGTGLDIVAPCVKIYTTDRMGSVGYSSTNYFATFNGTSSATPNCSGVAGLMLSKDSTQKWDTVRQRINRTALKKGSYSYTSMGPLSNLGNTWNNEMGYGIINANLALLAVGPPVPPLSNNVAVGPFLSFPTTFLINTTYAIKAQVSNVGLNGYTNLPIRFSVNGIIQTTNTIPSLPSGAVDSSSFNWTTPGSAGTFTLRIFSGAAVDSNRLNDTVTQVVNVLSSLPALCEQFVSTTFPPNDWAVSGSYWSRHAVSGFGLGSGSAKYDMWNAPAGTNQTMTSHTFPAAGPSASLKLDMAYSPYLSAQDSLVILTSTNAGTTYLSLVRLGPTQMQTAPPQTSLFTPTANQWAKRTYTIPIGTNKIQFLGKSQFGNNLYLDSICVDNAIGITQNGNTIPSVYSLSQNYPNPFNPQTNIRFGLPRTGLTKLVIYDVLGKVVNVLVNEVKEAGNYNVDFDATNLASGIYFYRIESGDFTDVKKMMVIK